MTVPASWAKDEIASLPEIATAELSVDYQAKTTRSEFCHAAIKFVELYYDKSIDEILSDRNLTPGTFNDTTDHDILAANALKICEGDGSGNAMPDQLLTRAHAAKFLNNILVNVIGLEDPEANLELFSDYNKIPAYAHTSVTHLFDLGVMYGTSNSVFEPLSNYTHEMSLVTFVRLWNALKK